MARLGSKRKIGSAALKLINNKKVENKSDSTITRSKNVNNKEKQFGHFLIKSEPESRIVKGIDVKVEFSLDDLKEKQTSPWEGVRNYEARNIMRDQMKAGDLCLFYHSNCKVPGIAGIAKVIKEAYNDYTAFDTSHPYFDAKGDASKPKWVMVDVKYVRHFKRFIPLKELQSYSELSDMSLIKRGRLSVQTVKEKEWEFILGLEEINKTGSD